jgi:tellurite resistance protein
MELLLGIVGFAVLIWFIAWAVRRSELSTNSGGWGSDVGSSGPPSFRLRLQEEKVGDKGEIMVQDIHARGGFPVTRTISSAAFYTSVLDETEGDSKPVLTPISQFQEADTTGYFFEREVGDIGPTQYFPEWVSIGKVIPEILTFPGSGKRKLKIVIRLVDINKPPDIELGFGDGALWTGTLAYEYVSDEKGYEEEAQHRDEARALCLKIGMTVAMADGSLDQSEGDALKKWVRDTIAPFGEEKQQELKDLYNEAMRAAYRAASDGSLTLSDSTSRLKEIGDEAQKIEAVELAYLVMNADGRIESSEVEVIRKVTQSLGLSAETIEGIKDKAIIGLDSDIPVKGGVDEILGIDPSWDQGQINRHLRTEFQKWNGRLNSLPAGAARDKAQDMLSRIGEARKKYDG